MNKAAAEYEAAWSEERASDLLYQLGIVRRRLREYAKAKEAFRGYLRAEPEGPLRDEVERQISQLNVLIDAQAQDAPARARPRRAPAPPVRPAAPADLGGSQRQTGAKLPTAEQQAAAKPEVGSTEQHAAAPADAASAPSKSPPTTAKAPVEQPETAAPNRSVPARLPAPAAAIAVAAPVAAQDHARAEPWLITGAVIAGAGGAALWWDGDRVARELDERFVSGDLTAADRGRYSRSRGESIAGRVLVAAALGLAGAAVYLW